MTNTTTNLRQNLRDGLMRHAMAAYITAQLNQHDDKLFPLLIQRLRDSEIAVVTARGQFDVTISMMGIAVTAQSPRGALRVWVKLALAQPVGLAA